MPSYVPVIADATGGVNLNMTYNRLTDLSAWAKTTSNYNSITELHLSHNRIEDVTADDLPRNLSVLSLDSNKLTVLQADMVARLEKLELLKLGNNEYECSCASKALYYFVKEYRDSIQVGAKKS